MHMVEASLGVGESSAGFLIVGQCDVLVEGLTAGAVKLQYKLPPSTLKAAPAWTDFPDESYTTDVYKTVFISEHGVQLRLTGVANNAATYVRLGRYLNK